jgi:hypothetical protein
MSLKEKRNVVAKIITYKFGYSPMVAESIADDMLHMSTATIQTIVWIIFSFVLPGNTLLFTE